MNARIRAFNLGILFAVLSCQRIAALQAHLAMVQQGTNFTYTVFNDETNGSQLFLSNIHVGFRAPLGSVSSPSGWAYVTDNLTYVDWSCTDSTAPFPHDVAPGASLAGFGLQSGVGTSEGFPCAVTSWDHGATNSGPAYQGVAPGPSIISFSPTVTNIVLSATNTFQFTVVGIPTFSYATGASTNLIDWTFVSTNASPFQVVDPRVPYYPARFYRLFFVPDGSSWGVLPD